MSGLEKFSNMLSETTKSFGKKSTELFEISKLNLNAQKKQEAILDRYEEIGKYVYARCKKVNFVAKEELISLINDIDSLEREIARCETLAMSIRNIKYCERCRVELEKEANYCPVCGRFL